MNRFEGLCVDNKQGLRINRQEDQFAVLVLGPKDKDEFSITVREDKTSIKASSMILNVNQIRIPSLKSKEDGWTFNYVSVDTDGSVVLRKSNLSYYLFAGLACLSLWRYIS